MLKGAGTIDETTHDVGNSAYQLAARLAALRSSGTYAHPTLSVEAIETHFAWVFLTDRFAYKLKKPMQLGLVDLRDLAARIHFCQEEVRLNRRLAPTTYLGVSNLTRETDGSLRVDGSGTPIEPLVKMHRLDRTLMLDRAIAGAGAADVALQAVARTLAEFYRAQPPIPFAAGEYRQRLAAQIRLNHDDLLAPDLELPTDVVDALIGEQRLALDRCSDELEQRAAAGRIVEAHGDLRPEHICLSDPPCIIDCLEFSRDLRLLDPAEELAYLQIECAHLGAAAVGRRIFDEYLALSGTRISNGARGLYMSHRATTRAKIVAWHVRDPLFKDHGIWQQRASAYLQLARQCLTDQSAPC